MINLYIAQRYLEKSNLTNYVKSKSFFSTATNHYFLQTYFVLWIKTDHIYTKMLWLSDPKNGHVYEKACFGKKKSFYSLDINPPPVCSLMASLIATHLADQLIRPDWLMALQFSTNYIFDWVLRAGKKWSCCAGLEKYRGQPLIFWLNVIIAIELPGS